MTRQLAEHEDRLFKGIVKLDFPVLAETGGPTYLTLGAVPDGYLLRRSGTALEGVDPDDVAVTDHGALDGLADDDHTQYLLVGGSRAMTGQLLLADAGWGFADAPTTRWTHIGFGQARFDISGTSRLNFSASQTSFPNTTLVDASGARIGDSTQRLVLGTSSPASGHSLATGDTHVVGALEVDGALWADAGGTFAGDWSSATAQGPMLENATASATNPTLIPDKSQPTWGIGSVNGQTLNFITNGGTKLSIDVNGTSTATGAWIWNDGTGASGAYTAWGTGIDSRMSWNTTQTPDALVLEVGTDSRNFLIIERGDSATDFAHAIQTNPTVWIHSSDATAPTQWLSLASAGTLGSAIGLGTGDLYLNVPTGIVRFGTGPTTTTQGFVSFDGTGTVVGVGGTSVMRVRSSELLFMGGHWNITAAGGLNMLSNSYKARLMQSQTGAGLQSVELIGSADAAGEIAVIAGTKNTDAEGGSAATLLRLATDVDGTPVAKVDFLGDGSSAYTLATSLASGSFNFANFAATISQSGTAGYTGLRLDITESSIGSGTKSLMDLRVGAASKFRVDNAGNLTMGNTIAGGGLLIISAEQPLCVGSLQQFILRGASTHVQAVIASGSGYGRHFVFTDSVNYAVDHAHAVQTHPTAFFHSATSPASDSTEWLSVHHDGVSGKITAGKGVVNLGTAAATSRGLTVGDVLVGGALEVNGVLYLDGGMISATGIEAPRFGASSALLHIGDSTPASGHSLGAGDVLFPGSVEVNGALWADGAATVAGLLTLGHATYAGQIYPVDTPSQAPAGTTVTVDWDTGPTQTVDLGSASGDVTVTFSNYRAGASYALRIIQGATPRTITWAASGGTVVWPEGTPPTISTGDNDEDLLGFVCYGTALYGSYISPNYG